MLSLTILVPAILNGLLTGAVYGLVALGLTLIYGVLHIINFAHGALLTAAIGAGIGLGVYFGTRGSSSSSSSSSPGSVINTKFGSMGWVPC